MMEITLAILAECTRGSHAYRNHRRGNDWFDIGEIVERGWTRGAPGVTSSRAEQPAGSAGWAAAMFPEARWGSKRSTPSTSRRFRVRRTAAGNASAYLAIRWSPMARELWSGCIRHSRPVAMPQAEYANAPRSLAAAFGNDGRAATLQKTALRRRARAGECHSVIRLSAGYAAHLSMEFRERRP
jgi:hypothetical protein